MSQQSQTLSFFKSHADAWQEKATESAYSVIDNRHKAVLEVMGNFPASSVLLDVGCGTGQLAVEAASRGWQTTGVDFAQEMIDQCEENSRAESGSAQFVCGSIFDFDCAPQSYDVISAQGFIEYISLDQLSEFLAFVHRALKPGGMLAVGSRNRLFNLHTLNEFTELESVLGTIESLIAEGRTLQMARSQQEAVGALAKLAFDYPYPTVHPITGIKVDTRYQFSPADLVARLAGHGLTASRVFPVHYHPLPISALADEGMKSVHDQFASQAADAWITRHNLVPYASSYVMEARKG